MCGTLFGSLFYTFVPNELFPHTNNNSTLMINDKDIKLHSDTTCLIDKADHEHARVCLEFDKFVEHRLIELW